MNTRQKIMGLAALPLAGLLATGGVAMAQTAASPAGTPANTQVVQQTATHGTGGPDHVAPAPGQQAQQQLRERNRDCGTCGDHQQVRTGDRTMDQLRLRDGSCLDR